MSTSPSVVYLQLLYCKKPNRLQWIVDSFSILGVSFEATCISFYVLV